MTQPVYSDEFPRLVAPNGKEIRGTLERLSGVAFATARRAPDGTVVFEHEGGTDIWWDEAKTVCRDGQPVFVDQGGNEWLGSQLVPAAEGDDA